MNRTLRSKKLRALLYYAQGGKCAKCGCDLPDDWHADHKTPWAVTKRTNVHDMQALCPRCNLQKGAKMLRRHQSQFQDIVQRIARGASKVRYIGVQVTPGGGKSALPMILGKELAESAGYLICWVVPRDALRRQAERDATDKQKRQLFGHQLTLRAAGNDWNPSRGNDGYVTNYQAIAQNPQLHWEEFEQRPYVLVLDECHHIPFKGESDDAEEAKYYNAIAPLVERAKIVVFMSGTLERHDGHKVAFWPYERFGGDESPITKTDASMPEWAFVRYTRKDALEEQAIVPLHFYAMDGRARWYDPKTDEERDVNSMAESSRRDASAVLQVVLETDYANQLLDKCAVDWQTYKATVYHAAKLLVIAPNISTAKEYSQHLRRSNFDALIATSDDSQQAKDHINRFKKNADILVTVGMAYEGLDVPQITHVACLTNIRSRPWIEQCICRANRTAPGKTHGYIYHPDDLRMSQIMQAIEAEQAAVVINWPPRPKEMAQGHGGGERVPIAPIDSAVTRARGGGLEDGTRVGYDETSAIEAAITQAGISCSVVQMKQALVAMGLAVVPNGTAPRPDYQESVTVPSEMEERLKESIYRTVNRVAWRKSGGNKERQHEIIKEINRGLLVWWPPRKECTVDQLQAILRYLAKEYSDGEEII